MAHILENLERPYIMMEFAKLLEAYFKKQIHNKRQTVETQRKQLTSNYIYLISMKFVINYSAYTWH